MKKILFVVGTLRNNSFNLQLAKTVEKLLENKAEVSYLDYSKVPVFSQDLETPVLDSVQEVRNRVLESDLIWIFSPSYNFFIPGPVKNLLDWLSRALDLSNPSGPSAINEKMVTVSSIAAAGHDEIFKQYQQLLTFIRTKIVGDFTKVKTNPEAWSTGKITVSKEDLELLKSQVNQVLENLK